MDVWLDFVLNANAGVLSYMPHMDFCQQPSGYLSSSLTPGLIGGYVSVRSQWCLH